MFYSDPDLPKKIRRLTPDTYVILKRRDAFAERAGAFWRVYSDPTVRKSEALMGSDTTKKGAWLKALIVIEREYED